MGKVISTGLHNGWIETWKIDGRLQTYDHTDLGRVATLDGTEVDHQSPVVIYRCWPDEWTSW